MNAIVPSVLAAALSAPACANELLAQKNGCTACHSIDLKVVGPAFHDIAQRYKDRADAVDYLVEKIRKGGMGTWGSVPMPMQPSLSNEDVRALAAWVLGQ